MSDPSITGQQNSAAAFLSVAQGAGRGCSCGAYNETECACGVDWTPRRVAELEAENSDLRQSLSYWQKVAIGGEIRRKEAEAKAFMASAAVSAGVHSCSIHCQRPLCVAKREIAELMQQRDEMAEELGKCAEAMNMADKALTDLKRQRATLLEACETAWPFFEEDKNMGCNSAAYCHAISTMERALSSVKGGQL